MNGGGFHCLEARTVNYPIECPRHQLNTCYHPVQMVGLGLKFADFLKESVL